MGRALKAGWQGLLIGWWVIVRQRPSQNPAGDYGLLARWPSRMRSPGVSSRPKARARGRRRGAMSVLILVLSRAADGSKGVGSFGCAAPFVGYIAPFVIRLLTATDDNLSPASCPSRSRATAARTLGLTMSCYPTSIHFKRLLLTGAAGVLGRQLRPRLKAHCCLLRVSDIAGLGSAAPGEELHPARLEDADAMSSLLEGVQAVVHLGGVSTEQPWEVILQANIIGAYNLYEAARKQAVPRVVFASSNHVTGFYRRDQVVGLDDPARPDGLYGLSKTFGEDLARLYFDRYGIETVCLRIGSALPEPHDRRTLATWISYDDLERLVVASLTAPMV